MKVDAAAWAKEAERELADRLNAASGPAETAHKVMGELNKMGHQLALDDEDGAEWQMWLSPNAVVHLSYPDMASLEAAELPHWNNAEGHFNDQVSVSVSLRKK